LGSEYQVFLERGSDGKDYMTIKVERAEGASTSEDKALASQLEYTINHQILVSGKVEIVDFQSLPRTERKSKRVFDHR
jgi:phenylacetate-CoA ligase